MKDIKPTKFCFSYSITAYRQPCRSTPGNREPAGWTSCCEGGFSTLQRSALPTQVAIFFSFPFALHSHNSTMGYVRWIFFNLIHKFLGQIQHVFHPCIEYVRKYQRTRCLLATQDYSCSRLRPCGK
jgi:hypothetical protein